MSHVRVEGCAALSTSTPRCLINQLLGTEAVRDNNLKNRIYRGLWADTLRKAPEEIECLRRAAHVADIGFNAGREVGRPGVTENALAGLIEKAIRDNGSTWSWAITGGTEVGSGHRRRGGAAHEDATQGALRLIASWGWEFPDL